MAEPSHARAHASVATGGAQEPKLVQKAGYRDNAQKRERLAKFVDSIGIENVKDALG